jgi:hypothetical protein
MGRTRGLTGTDQLEFEFPDSQIVLSFDRHGETLYRRMGGRS